MNSQLCELVTVDKDKCVNCHACISVCPVKFCNNGSGNSVVINPNLCLGCGNCIDACTHQARYYLDDWPAFAHALQQCEKMVAVVAPAVAASFPNTYLQLNTLLKKMGIDAIFDVSFGAELTVHSYLKHISSQSPQCVIAQPCPALVTYIEVYKPELIPHLAPADSPMLHTIKMLREYYPQFRDHKIMVVSPCMAKRREFDATGLGDYNVTLATLQRFIEVKEIDLTTFEPSAYDNPSAERAVLFSSPGGLLETAMREIPEIAAKARKIEGPEHIYHYLDSLPHEIAEGRAPMLIDCLNCAKGCNGGPGTNNRHEPLDKLDTLVKERSNALKNEFRQQVHHNGPAYSEQLADFWREGLYARSYTDRSDLNTLVMPTKEEVDDIFLSMKKFSNEDIVNCSSCGYGNCHDMAVAIHNNLNRKENCHHYKGHVITEVALELTEAIGQVTKFNDSIHQMMTELANMSALLKRDFVSLHAKVEEDKKLIDEFGAIANTIANIAYKTDILAINAAIEAARAGSAGKGFNIVAEEVKRLSLQSGDETDKIKPRLSHIEALFREISQKLNDAMPHFERTQVMTSDVSDLISQTNSLQMEKLKGIGNEFNGLVKKSMIQEQFAGLQ